MRAQLAGLVNGLPDGRTGRRSVHVDPLLCGGAGPSSRPPPAGLRFFNETDAAVYRRTMMDQRPTPADVARAAGVSMAAASRAMNGAYGASEAGRQRVREVAAELGFEPHAVARALATGRASAGRRERVEVLIVDPDPDAMSAKPFYGRVLAGAMRALADRDISLEVSRVAALPVDDADPPFGRLLINAPGDAGAAYARRGRTVALGRSAPGVTFRPNLARRQKAVRRAHAKIRARGERASEVTVCRRGRRARCGSAAPIGLPPRRRRRPVQQRPRAADTPRAAVRGRHSGTRLAARR